MKKACRLVTLLLVVLMLLSTFAANGSGGSAQAQPDAPELATTWPEFAQFREVQYYYIEHGATGPVAGMDFVAPEIAKRTNLQLNYDATTVVNVDAYNQRINLMMASQDIPEVTHLGSDEVAMNAFRMLGKAGYTWDIAPMIQDYPNLYNLLSAELNMFRDPDTGGNYLLPTENGKGYGRPGYGAAGAYGVYIRKDWLDLMGMDYPRTPDEVYTYLKRCKEEMTTITGQEVIPLTFDRNLRRMDQRFLAVLFCPLNYYNDMHPHNYAGFELAYDPKENNIVNYGYTDSPELYQAAYFINKLYREGLLDPEVLTIQTDQLEEKITNGRVGMHVVEPWRIEAIHASAQAIVPDLMYVYNPQFITDTVPKYTDTKYTAFISNSGGIMCGKKMSEEAVRHFLAMLDYLCTEEGQLLAVYGLEGQSYTFDSDGKVQWMDEFKQATDDLLTDKKYAYGVDFWACMARNATAIEHLMSDQVELKPDALINYLNRKDVVVDKYDPDMIPDAGYYLTAGPIELEKIPYLQEARLEMWAKVIQASSDAEIDSILREYGQTCVNLGINEIIAEKQAFLDAFEN